ncbi:hypothetical protein TNCT_560411 [Trichonephila clavata]|uniref:Uncharacterized protein n=1 Tax=Trichonephila clavata TaxID=2740835 RepID=A0A8X6LGF3_TRICU|nr:hypothetical protein TNCT_560411 [Trichonephila clavata]
MHAGWSTATRRPVLRWGSVMFLPPRHDIHRPVEESRTELCIHRPCVLMNAGWSYCDPSGRYMRRSSVMFITPRHDIHRPLKKFRTEICIHRPYVLMHAEWPTATRPPGVCGGVA